MTELNQNYYKVVAKCGHVGKCNYVPIIFAVVAENGIEADNMLFDDVDLYPKNEVRLEEILADLEIN